MVAPAERRQITFLLDDALIREIKVTAADLRCYPNAVVTAACREFIERHRKLAREAKQAAAAS